MKPDCCPLQDGGITVIQSAGPAHTGVRCYSPSTTLAHCCDSDRFKPLASPGDFNDGASTSGEDGPWPRNLFVNKSADFQILIRSSMGWAGGRVLHSLWRWVHTLD